MFSHALSLLFFSSFFCLAYLTTSLAEAMCIVYDYTVLAGTQGGVHHLKLDRALELAYDRKLPLLLFPEGGGGRAAANFGLTSTGLGGRAWSKLVKLRSVRPVLAAVSGYCFAGNAALLACAHVVVATVQSSIGMGGPAMILGGGLGNVPASDVGPGSMHYKQGLVDVLVSDDAEMVRCVRSLCSHMHLAQSAGVRATPAPHTDAVRCQEGLRTLVPPESRRVFKMRDAIAVLCDDFIEMGLAESSVITGLARIDGRSVAIAASNCLHRSGALDAAASQKLAKFYGQVSGQFRVPCLVLLDTPGFLVGVEAEREGLVAAAGQLFSAAAAAAGDIRTSFFVSSLSSCFDASALFSRPCHENA
jgi:methylmalonyl-CoA carboxyltransferase large subunit